SSSTSSTSSVSSAAAAPSKRATVNSGSLLSWLVKPVETVEEQASSGDVETEATTVAVAVDDGYFWERVPTDTFEEANALLQGISMTRGNYELRRKINTLVVVPAVDRDQQREKERRQEELAQKRAQREEIQMENIIEAGSRARRSTRDTKSQYVFPDSDAY
ncbi:MAG: hypothetical protein Q8P67_01465, partial [archaeon]|nr:hypothetical protein [archaeon]